MDEFLLIASLAKPPPPVPLATADEFLDALEAVRRAVRRVERKEPEPAQSAPP